MVPHRPFGVPGMLFTDAYKLSHYSMYPNAEQMSAYSEFRSSFLQDKSDHRIVFHGIRYIVENYIAKKWTVEDIDKAEAFLQHSNVGGTNYPFPKEIFYKFIKENDGYFPIRIKALPEGSVIYPHVPILFIEAYEEYAPLVTYFETILNTVWYPSCVATQSRRIKDIIINAFLHSVDPQLYNCVKFRLGDFGMRSCTSMEQSIIGGVAHLISFESSSTLPASYYAQYKLNNGQPVSVSIPSTEHSVITAWHNELTAIEQVLEKYGSGVISILFDTYDYSAALESILPAIKTKKLEKGGIMVIRPDSGNVIDSVVSALRAAEAVFGTDLNSKGFKVLKKCAVIQGDGICAKSVKDILEMVHESGFSAENVYFGMGSCLLQKVHRDVLMQATKLSYVKFKDGSERNVMKCPKTDYKKASLPGKLFVARDSNGIPIVYPAEYAINQGFKSMHQIVYDGMEQQKRYFNWETFDVIRERTEKEWNMLPKLHDSISCELREKMRRLTQEIRENASAIAKSG